MDNIFQYATRNKLRFSSVKGEVSTEQLWDIPLRSNDGFDLDGIARTANKAFKEATEDSFVSTARTPASIRLEKALETVKHVIEVKISDEAATKLRAGQKLEKEKLLQILAEKQDGKLSTLSEKEIKSRIAALST